MIHGVDNTCCGCTACLSICNKQAIYMVENEKGFVEPIVDKTKCIDCGLCDRVCPLHLIPKSDKEHLFFAAKRIDPIKRAASQSGGAFATLAEYVLQLGGVVYGVSQNINFEAVYSRIARISEIKQLLGSKYIQARMENCYVKCGEDLTNGKYVLFSGTPCHVHGLILYLNMKRIDTTQLITVDIICHGVPSPRIFREYIKLLETRHKKKISSFNHRDKHFGWHGHVSIISVGHRKFQNNDFVKSFYSHYILRDCCYSCQYTSLNRVGDITIGDCWGIEKSHSEFDDNLGISLVIINSTKGKSLWEKTAHEFDLLSMKQDEIMQHNLQFPTVAPDNILQFWSDYKTYGCEYVLYRYCNYDPRQETEVIEKNQYARRMILKLSRLYHRFFTT